MIYGSTFNRREINVTWSSIRRYLHEFRWKNLWHPWYKLRLTQVNFVMLSFPNFRDMSRQNSQLTQRNCEFYANNLFDQLKCGAWGDSLRNVTFSIRLSLSYHGPYLGYVTLLPDSFPWRCEELPSVPLVGTLFSEELTERCCFAQLLKTLKVVHSVSDRCFFAPALRKAIRHIV
jgi:hypothetical protein